MAGTSQKRAVENYRARMQARGMRRFEVVGLDSDRELIRSLAKRLADGDPQAAQIREKLRESMTPGPGTKGRIYASLRSSPLVGEDIDFSREHTTGRKIDL